MIRNIRNIRNMAIVATISLGLVACGGSDDSSSSDAAPAADAASAVAQADDDDAISAFGTGEVAEIRELLANHGAPVAETKCVAEALAGGIDQAELAKILDAADTGDVDADIDVDTAVAFNEAITACGLN